MNSRPSKMKSLHLNRQDKPDDRQSSSSKLTSTPIAQRITMIDDELSPIQIRCTQDGGDDELDVVWDWNSPQSRKKKSFKQRKRATNKSPQIPRKIPPKSNLIPKFTSLRAELEKLNKSNDYIDLNDNKKSDDVMNKFAGNKCKGDTNETEDKFNLAAKNIEVMNKFIGVTNRKSEETNKFIELSNKCMEIDNPPNRHPRVQNKFPGVTNKCMENTRIEISEIDCDDLFGDDSFDDDLVRCSQQIEDTFTKPQPPQSKTLELLINKSCGNIADDSFDAMLGDYTEDDIIKFSQTSPEKCTTPVKNSRTIYRTNSTPVRYQKPPERSENSMLPRTKSAEVCGSPRSNVITFSPEEIEKKRLEAKAKLELKKAQKVMEKRRLEALERLNKNRLQRIKNK